MAFRLSVNQASDLTTIGVAGRLGADAIVILGEACGGARRPLVLDLSDLTSASNAGVLLLRRLASEGVHLLGASRYVRLLLEDVPGLRRAHIARATRSPTTAGERTRSETPVMMGRSRLYRGGGAPRPDHPGDRGRGDAAAFSAALEWHHVCLASTAVEGR